MKRLVELCRWFIITALIFAISPLLVIVVAIEIIVNGTWLKRLILTAIVLAVAFGIIGYCAVSHKIGDPGKEYSILVLPGDNAGDLYHHLKESGLSVNRRLYSIFMSRTGIDRGLRPGRYRIKGGQTPYRLVLAFRDTTPELSKVTIPEGWTLRQIVPTLARGIPTDSSELAQLLADTAYFRTFGIDAPGFEGYLFPETYDFFPYESPRNVIAEMVRMFQNNFTPTLRQRARDLKMSVNQVVTLASLIETEAADGKERELISSVFHNRLRLGWKLQCDPTVIYALGGLNRPLTRKDLDFDSPYNTYLYYGLPPGPICSPGLASIKAALYPAETNFTYFVATGSGQHVFSASLEEHNRATSRIHRNQRLQNRN